MLLMKVVNEVSYGHRVYLTRNGHGSCAIIDMQELDELEALNQLLIKLQEAEKSVITEGTIGMSNCYSNCLIFILKI